MSTSGKWESGTLTTIMSTDLNSLVNGAAVVSSVLNGTGIYDNTAAGANNYMYADFELVVTYGSNATVNNTVDLYALPSIDASNYADGAAATAPSQDLWLCSFVMRAATAHRLVEPGPNRLILLPNINMKFYLKDGSGQNFPASGSTVKMLPFRPQSV